MNPNITRWTLSLRTAGTVLCKTQYPSWIWVARPKLCRRGLLAWGRAYPQHRGRALEQNSEVFIGLDVAKARHAVAIAGAGRSGDVRYFGEIDSDPVSVRRMVARLEKRHRRLHFRYEAGPTGYGLHRQPTAMGHDCTVVAPSLIPKRPGDRVKR